MPPLMIVGETWGEEEAKTGVPFSGAAGRLMKAIMSQTGIPQSSAYLTNVLNYRVPVIDRIYVKKADSLPGVPPIAQGKYLPREVGPEIERLRAEIEQIKPNLILTLGSVASTVVAGEKISLTRNRGGLFQTRAGLKMLPTYHPSSIFKDWKLRPVVIADFAKAARHMQTPEFIRPSRIIYIPDTIADLYEFRDQYLFPRDRRVGVDIETKSGSITEIGFAPTPDRAIVVPFYSRDKADGNYWPAHASEKSAVLWVKEQCEELTNLVFQNGLYDVNYLWRKLGIRANIRDDTMLCHHSMQPEMKKSLGFLGSIYTDEPPWKMMRSDNETLKAGDDE